MGINQLPREEKRSIYTRLIPEGLKGKFRLNDSFVDSEGNDLILLRDTPGNHDVEMALFHQADVIDPILYGHLTDTVNSQIHILLYILNDPSSPRFDIDRLPDGRPTVFGTKYRNIEAEIAAKEYGLAPGQVRRGLRMLSEAIRYFEVFVKNLDHEIYFAEPLYYHNAVIFERYGFAYAKGRKFLERIQEGFSAHGDLVKKLDGSTPFRNPGGERSIRCRSWAIHDGILGEPFNNVTMYKAVGKSAGIGTCLDCDW
jgi:hypothetical protein